MGAAAFIMADVIGQLPDHRQGRPHIPSSCYLTLPSTLKPSAHGYPAPNCPQRGFGSAPPLLPVPAGVLITILLMGRSVIACAYYGTVCIVIRSERASPSSGSAARWNFRPRMP